MKKLLLTFGLIFLSIISWAQNVSRSEALQIAERFFAQRLSSPNHRAIKSDEMSIAYTSQGENEKTALYVVNCGNNDGFVIVAGDADTNHPVLGWSDHGNFDYDKAPIQLKDMLDTYSHRCQQTKSDEISSDQNMVKLKDGSTAIVETNGEHQTLVRIPILPHKQTATHRVESEPKVVVAPLVKVQWNQSGDYAKYVDPFYNWVGCVPTAMAQVMAYWKFPAHGRGFHMHNFIDAPDDVDFRQLQLDYIYGNRDGLLNALAQYSRQYNANFSESTYQWNNMGGTHPETEAEWNNVAKLLFDCHVACAPTRMPNDRGTGASTSTAVSSMVRYFGYSPEIQEVWNIGNGELLQQELEAGRPILMEGQPSSGATNTDGHAFVCDGYAEDGYYHFNFGWSGSGDGYYLLNDISPNMNDFSKGLTAYIGIQPSLAAVEMGHAFINVNPDGMGIVVGGYGDVIVPETVEKDGKSYPVMKVENRAFIVPTSSFETFIEDFAKENLKTITLSNSVTEIGDYAFTSQYLTEVTLSNNIRSIGANAFFYKDRLEKVNVPSIEAWLNIEFQPERLDNGFDRYWSNPIWSTDKSGKTKLYIAGEEATSIIIPGTVKEVKPSTFMGYQFLKSVTMEEGVEKIGASAFDLVPLKEIHFASTVKEIGAKAFYQHQASTIEIPANLTKVGREALYGEYIAEYIVDENNPKYSSYQGILYDRARRTLVHCPNFRPGFSDDKYRTTVGVPSTVTAIRAHAFGSNLLKLIIPASVHQWEDEAFAYASRLKELYLYTSKPMPITSSMFHSTSTSMWNKTNVHVPVGSGDAYKATPIWQDMNIVEDEDVSDGGTPPEHYDYTTDYNAIEIGADMEEDGMTVYKYTYYLFDAKPIITFTGTSMLLTTETSKYVFEKDNYTSFLFTMRFTHYDVPTSIDEAKVNKRNVVIRSEGDQLIISGLNVGERVILYSIDGRQLTSDKASVMGDVAIDIPAADLIVVKAGNQSFKIHTKK